MSEKQIYQLPDGIRFRLCEFGDCKDKTSHWSGHTDVCPSDCGHEGAVHFHCHIHREIELIDRADDEWGATTHICVICESDPNYNPPPSLTGLHQYDIEMIDKKAKALLNSGKFKRAKLIHLGDYYSPEISGRDLVKKNSKYWISYDLKTNQSDKPLLILYIGSREEKTKSQFFIDPESKKLSHDHADDDPLSIIARIEVEFKDGSIELKSK